MVLSILRVLSPSFGFFFLPFVSAGGLSQSIDIEGDNLFYHLGGRDIITGAEETILEPGQIYDVRITAFNAFGAGEVNEVKGIGPLKDMVPTAPRSVIMSTNSSDDLVLDFCTPELDGGSAIERYVVKYDTSDHFEDAKSVVAPVVREKQSFVVESPDVQNEVQTVRATVEVMNEVQSVRSTVNGIDEIQMVTTSADKVYAEVQTVTTTAIDNDEEQVISVVADDIDEIQLVQIHGDDVPEVQAVTVSVDRIDEVQRLGVLISNINTDGDGVVSAACYGISVGEPCEDIENAISGSFTASFDFDSCGVDSIHGVGSNYCQEAISLYEPSLGDISCSPGLISSPRSGGGHCVSAPVTPQIFGALEGNPGTLQKAINDLVDDNGKRFMTVLSIPVKHTGVTVTRNSRIKTKGSCFLDPSGGPATCSGQYEILYNITFDAFHTSGNVPSLVVEQSNIRVDTSSSEYNNILCPGSHYASGCSLPIGSAADGTYGNFYDNSASDTAVEYVQGTQPRGMIALSYECESSVTVLPEGNLMSTSISGLQATFDSNTFSDGIRVGQYLRFSSGDGIDFYRNIVATDNNSDQITFDSPVPSEAIYGDVEYGFYYSDWERVDNSTGVSDLCLRERIHKTLPVDIDIRMSSVSTRDWEGKIGGLGNIDSTGIIVSRSLVEDLFSSIGFVWRVTFTKQPGNVNEINCMTISDGADCSVTTEQQSSVVGGAFKLSTTWPHEYESEVPTIYFSDHLQSNVDASTLKASLESIYDDHGTAVFGFLDVVRSSYVPPSHMRWAGGYLWTISFVSRGGNIPAIGTDDSNLIGSNVRLEVADENSGVADTYQGIPNYAYFSADNPGTARDGNQVSGSFALSWDGNRIYDALSTMNIFSIRTGGEGPDRHTALSASAMEALLHQHLLRESKNRDRIAVTRSSNTSQWMSYTYTIVFRHQDVGGDVPPVVYVETTSSLFGQGAVIAVTEGVQGTSIRGTFNLRFNGETTRPINHDASDQDMQDALNQLSSIAPSAVIVSRTPEPVVMGPPDGRSGLSTQVGGYIWYVTFSSNVWKDPTISHDLSYIPGNWFGPAAVTDENWESGFSKAWGKNVGNVPLIECVASGLSTSYGDFPDHGCLVEEAIRGTDPLGGGFTLCLDSSTYSNGVMSVREDACTDLIAHNAPASAIDSDWDGSSLEEKLEALPNVGDLTVTRGPVDSRNGGYSWFVTFLRDADGPCQQRDEFTGFCNSPGNVPKICQEGRGSTPCDLSQLRGSCERPGSCMKMNVVDVEDSATGSLPFGPAERLVIATVDSKYTGWEDGSVVDISGAIAEYKLSVNGTDTSCIRHNAQAHDIEVDIKAALNHGDSSDTGVVRVERRRSNIDAPNGFLYYVDIYDVGEPMNISVGINAGLCKDFKEGQEVRVERISDHSVHQISCNNCINGLVQRGRFTAWGVSGEPHPSSPSLSWDASPFDVATHIQAATGRFTEVSRIVLDKYGAMEWSITFVGNPGVTPPGAGEVPLLEVLQDADSGGVFNSVIISRVQRGSVGLGGFFSIDYFSSSGEREIAFDEPAARFQKKLSEMSTIGQVYVTRDCYPDCSSGGWGNVAIPNQSESKSPTRGGYEWKIYFLRNPGIYDGFTFPPGSGSIDSPAIQSNMLFGSYANVKTTTLFDGSEPLSGTFLLDVSGEKTVPLQYAADSLLIEQSMYDLRKMGSVAVKKKLLATRSIPGVTVRVALDGTVVRLEEDGSQDSIIDLRIFFAPGDKFRVVRPPRDNDGHFSISPDKATQVGTAKMIAKSPVLSGSDLNQLFFVGEQLQIKGEDYTVLRNGIEVQAIAISRSAEVETSEHFFQIQASTSGATERTTCLKFDALADDLENALSELSIFPYGMISVSRTDLSSGSFGDPHIYRVYFIGNATATIGDVQQLVVQDCSAGLSAGVNRSNSNMSVRTLAEGGNVEHQRVSLSSDSGTTAFVPAFRLTIQNGDLGSTQTPCIEWGAPSLGLTAALVDHLKMSIDLSVGSGGISLIESTSSSELYFIETSDFVDVGIIMSDDVIAAGSSCTGRVQKIAEGGKGVKIEVLEERGCFATPGDIISIVKDTLVVESFSGKLEFATQIALVTVTSDLPIEADQDSYKLRLTHNGVSRTTSCLRHDATAVDVEMSINGLFDFNLDGAINNHDWGHIRVTREGGRSLEYGLGYQYQLESKGSPTSGGVSTVLGSGAPTIDIEGIGDAVGCSDAGARTGTLISNQTSVMHGSPLVTSLTSFATANLSARRRIRIDASSSDTKVYSVQSISEDGFSLLLEEPFDGSTEVSSASIYGIEGGIPRIEASVHRQGTDEYIYDVYFAGSGWSDVPKMTINVFGDESCQANTTHVENGANRNMAVTTIVNGGRGSSEGASAGNREYVIDRPLPSDAGSETAPVLLLPPMFTVLADSFEVQRLIVKDIDSTVIWQGNGGGPDPSFKLTYNDHLSDCLSYRSSESDIESALASLTSLCSSSEERCATVSRTIDAAVAPNGYIFTIYFCSECGKDNCDLAQLKAKTEDEDCVPFLPENGEIIEIQTLQDGSSSTPFTASQLPLAEIHSPTRPARWAGNDERGLILYRLTGTMWTVSFDNYLGNVLPLSISAKELPDTARAFIFDNVVTGKNPSKVHLSGLITGIPYYAQVSAVNAIGESKLSDIVSAVPGDVPPSPTTLSVGNALQVNEVQSISLAATHIAEVQQISTSAAPTQEVQEVIIESPPGNMIHDGNFSLRVPEAQVVQWRAPGPVFAGSFYLELSLVDLASSLQSQTGSFEYRTLKTDCIPFDASANYLKRSLENRAIENGLPANSTRVTRSGDGSYSSQYGYSYEIEFIGASVRGHMNMLSSDFSLSGWDAFGGNTCESFRSHSGDASLTISKLGTSDALGTDTPIAEITVATNLPIVIGQYQISVFYLGHTFTTDCIDWNVKGLFVKKALETLSNVDFVLVDLVDAVEDGFFKSHSYTIHFNGQGMHTDGTSGAPGFNPSDLELIVGEKNCSSFKAYENNVLKDISLIEDAEVILSIVSISSGGHHLSASSNPTSSHLLADNLLRTMPMYFDDSILVAQSLKDEEDGVTYTIAFDEYDGNIPGLVCNADKTLSNIPASCMASTIMDGNSITGYFFLGPSEPLSHDASAKEVEEALEATGGIGNIEVTRGEADGQGGYTWLVTFVENTGDVEELLAFNSLQGKEATVRVEELTKGNEMQGTYRLLYEGLATEPIALETDANGIKKAMFEKNSSLGDIIVTSTGKVDSEGGRRFEITFTDPFAGDVPLLRVDASHLIGTGASVSVIEETKGSQARGNALHISFDMPRSCSSSQVDPMSTCGASITEGEIQVDESGDYESASTLSLNIFADYSIQIVEVASSSLWDQSLSTETVRGSFQLGYGEELTQPLTASASTSEVRYALEALHGVQTVGVSRELGTQPLNSNNVCIDIRSGSSLVTCNMNCECRFASSGLRSNDLVQMEDRWFRVSSSYNGSETSFILSTFSNSLIEAHHMGVDLEGVDLFAWSGGHKWTVTFHKVLSSGVNENEMDGKSTVLPLTSPEHRLYPIGSFVQVRLPDCKKCMYLDELMTWRKYYFRSRLKNSNGWGKYSTDETIGTPRSVPTEPGAIELNVISGKCLEVSFSQPNDPPYAEDILSYVIEVDITNNFTSETSRREDVQCTSPRCWYQICDLHDSKEYYVRAAARNSVEIQGNADWSTVLSAMPVNQPPGPPVDIFASVLSSSSIQIIFRPPLRNGGVSVTHYIFELSEVETTASEEVKNVERQVSVNVDSIDALLDGRFVYDLVDALSLSVNVPCMISAKARNVVGTGEAVRFSLPLVPSGPPDAPIGGALFTKTSSAAPITEATVTWSEIDNGLQAQSILGYRVDWWSTHDTVPEVQVIKLYYSAPLSATKFSLSYSPNPGTKKETAMLPFNAPADLVRRELINLGWDEMIDENLLQDVSVQRSTSSSSYTWRVTFGNNPDRKTNDGDIVSLSINLKDNGDIGSPTASVTTSQSGRRASGRNEVQTVLIIGSDPTQLTGFYRLKFLGSEYSPFIAAHASAVEVERALNQISSTSHITVTKRYDPDPNSTTISNGKHVIHHYKVTFPSLFGNVDSLVVDDANVVDRSANNGNTISPSVVVHDGDNELDVFSFKAYHTVPGEEPTLHGFYEDLGPSDTSFTIPNLIPGKRYSVVVSAKNAHGYGPIMVPLPSSIVPPLQVPGKPENVSLAVHTGYIDSVLVNFDPPTNDGGDKILRYRVELDPSFQFNHPIVEEFDCPTSNKPTVWKVETASDAGSTISGGSFSLDLQVNGHIYTTADIPYDATALMHNETETVQEFITQFVTTSGTSLVQSVPATNLETILFPRDRIRFGGQSMPFKYYEVESVNTNIVSLTEDYEGINGLQSSTKRYYGGRGDPSSSRIHCQYEQNLCSKSTQRKSGSMQSKLEDLAEAITTGVLVDRDGPTAQNTFIWRVTFLDDALPSERGFSLSLATNELTTVDGVGSATVLTTLLSAGETYKSCHGTLVVPSYGGLVKGLNYHARVSAINSEGYSRPALASKAQAPMITPSAPNGVTVGVKSATELLVMFGSPSDNGGSEITQYIVEWTTKSDFSDFQASTVDFLADGAPFFYTISELHSGVEYFIRVAARNKMGIGMFKASIPPNLNPHEAPDAPSNVKVGVTSDTMVTVGWDPPASNGGDDIAHYRIEWDIRNDFRSFSLPPNKGYKDEEGSSRSMTIELLSSYKTYFVRVSAINRSGTSNPKISSPSFVIPGKQVPGVPFEVMVSSGTSVGSLTISWQYPRVPHHQIPCGGVQSLPSNCPLVHGGSFASSDGGSPILEYEVEVSEYPNFVSSLRRTTPMTMATISDLVPSRDYYARVLARNAVGSGAYSSAKNAQSAPGSDN